MALYLVQHGKNVSKTQDPEKGLSLEGREDTKRISEVAKGYHVDVRVIFHSGLKRARETSEILSDYLKPEKGIGESGGLKPLDSVEDFSEKVSPDNHMMVVGHLPFLEKLVSFLVAGDISKRVFKFQNSGIVCLDCDESGWYIKWTLMPDIK